MKISDGVLLSSEATMKHAIHSLLFLFLLISCDLEAEKITPIADPEKISDQDIRVKSIENNTAVTQMIDASSHSLDSGNVQDIEVDTSNDQNETFTIKMKYTAKSLDVYGITGSDAQSMGDSFLKFFAKILFAIKGAVDVDIEDYVLDISEFDIDRDVIKSVKINTIKFRYAKSFIEETGLDLDFGFINYFDIATPIQIGNQQQENILFVYKKENNECNLKCIEIDIFTDNMLDLIENKKSLTVASSLYVEDIPHEELIIDGSIEFEVKIKTPF